MALLWCDNLRACRLSTPLFPFQELAAALEPVHVVVVVVVVVVSASLFKQRLTSRTNA